MTPYMLAQAVEFLSSRLEGEAIAMPPGYGLKKEGPFWRWHNGERRGFMRRHPEKAAAEAWGFARKEQGE